MTGYPADLLDLDLDLEADLGVDTVNRPRCSPRSASTLDVERDDNLQLRDFPTLTHVIGWVRDKTGIRPRWPRAGPVPHGTSGTAPTAPEPARRPTRSPPSWRSWRR